MGIHIKQECPLCDTSAEYCWVDSENVKYFECKHCGMFQISSRAEEVLRAGLLSRKSIYSEQVKITPEDYLLFIRMPSPEFRLQSDDPLQAEFTPKSKLSLKCT